MKSWADTYSAGRSQAFSHSTFVRLLRSANRAAWLPQTASDKVGFRVVLGALPPGKSLPLPAPQLHAQNISQATAKIEKAPADVPFFDGPKPFVIIPPNSFALARTVEYFRIPSDVLVVCLGKSTYARCGLIVNVTPLEPEWEGHVTLEFSNTTPLPAKIYANEGVAQMLFYQSDEQCEVTYKQRGGKYMGQTGVTPPKA